MGEFIRQGQESITQCVQLPCTSVVAFSLTSLFLERFLHKVRNYIFKPHSLQNQKIKKSKSTDLKGFIYFFFFISKTSNDIKDRLALSFWLLLLWNLSKNKLGCENNYVTGLVWELLYPGYWVLTGVAYFYWFQTWGALFLYRNGMSKSVRVLELESSHESCKSCISLYLESPGVVRQSIGIPFYCESKKKYHEVEDD